MPVATRWGEIQVKVAALARTVVNVAPEFEECKAVAQKEGLPLKQVMAVVLQNYYQGRNDED